jgi:hypothetical protein
MLVQTLEEIFHPEMSRERWSQWERERRGHERRLFVNSFNKPLMDIERHYFLT